MMQNNHAELAGALDPLTEDGAVARFLKSLREELKGADVDRAQQLQTALAALNANDETSLISRLVRETAQARQVLLHAVNPDAPESPMASIRQTLTTFAQGACCLSGERNAIPTRAAGQVREGGA